MKIVQSRLVERPAGTPGAAVGRPRPRGLGAWSGPVAALAVACAVLGLAGWVVYGIALRGQVGEDAMVFHTASRAWAEGEGTRIYDGVWLTGQINARFAGWLAAPLRLHPWIYPPSFLLMLLPFEPLPFAAALAGFLGAGFAALCWALRRNGRASAPMVLSLLLSPATAVNVLLGQNAFLTAALLAGGAGLLRRAPASAGVLLGLASYKPQLCLMVPVALLAGRHWRAAVVAGLAAAGLALASAVLLGPDLWGAWLGVMTGGGALFRDWAREARLNGMSVYACAARLGAGPRQADAVQGAAVLLAAAAVHRAYRAALRDEHRLAILLAATFLAAPHTANYDAVLLCIAATLAVFPAGGGAPATATLLLAGAVWLCPLFNPPSLFSAGLLTPPLVLALMAVLLGRTGAAAAVVPPAPLAGPLP